MRNKKKARIGLLLICAICLLHIFSTTAYAAGIINTESNVSLTINYRANGSPISDANFKIYEVATVTETVKFTITDEFAEYPVNLDVKDNSDWIVIANTLAGYIARDGVSPIDSGYTDASGILTFPNVQPEMTTGLYLVIGDSVTHGDTTYTPQPFLISLPNRLPTNVWEYNVTAAPKTDITHTTDDDTQTRKVIKIWEDDNNHNRPESVEIQLLCDNLVFDTVELNDQNNWRYTWTSLDTNHQWQVVEKTVPDDYTVSIGIEGITFVVTNSKDIDIPNPPVPLDPTEPSLPQTGMLWWPVPLLAITGMLFCFIGWAIIRKKVEE